MALGIKHPRYLNWQLTQDEIDDWIAYNQFEPIWPTWTNWLRQAFSEMLGLKSVVESTPIEQNDEQKGMAAYQAFSGLMSEADKKTFLADLADWMKQQKEAQSSDSDRIP